MKTIYINIADCDDNETFEQIVEDAGLSRFDEFGNPKENAETLTIEGDLTSNDTAHSITLFRHGGLDESTFNEILRTFNLSLNTPSLTIKVSNAALS